jgi:hypothetical protein
MDKIVGWLGNMLKSLADKAKSVFFKPRTFSVGKESHRIYAEDKNVMLASAPARLSGALTRFKNMNPPPSATTQTLIIQTEAKGNQLQSNLNKNDPALEPTNEKLRDEIVALMMKIMYEIGGTKSATMPQAIINFNISGDAIEFKRQIGMQQSAIIGMKVGDWQKNRARFIAFGRESRSVDSDAKRISEFAKKIIADVNAIAGLSTGDKTKLLKFADSTGKISQSPGITLANEVAKNMIESRSARGEAVLHTADQVAGGSATAYGDKSGVLGNSAINSSIGSQWKDRISEVDSKAANVDETANVNVQLNAG